MAYTGKNVSTTLYDTYSQDDVDSGFVAKDGSGNVSITGNVGVGTSSPDTLLQATNTATSTNYISYEIGSATVDAANKGGFGIYELGGLKSAFTYVRDGSADTELWTSGNLSFAAGSSERMRIDGNGFTSVKKDACLVTENTYSANAGSSYTITLPSSHGMWELAIYAYRNNAGAYGTRYQVYHLAGLAGYPYSAWSSTYNLVTNIERIQTSAGPTISVATGVNGAVTVTISGTGNLGSGYAVRQLCAGPSY